MQSIARWHRRRAGSRRARAADRRARPGCDRRGRGRRSARAWFRARRAGKRGCCRRMVGGRSPRRTARPARSSRRRWRARRPARRRPASAAPRERRTPAAPPAPASGAAVSAPRASNDAALASSGRRRMCRAQSTTAPFPTGDHVAARALAYRLDAEIDVRRQAAIEAQLLLAEMSPRLQGAEVEKPEVDGPLHLPDVVAGQEHPGCVRHPHHHVAATLEIAGAGRRFRWRLRLAAPTAHPPLPSRARQKSIRSTSFSHGATAQAGDVTRASPVARDLERCRARVCVFPSHAADGMRRKRLPGSNPLGRDVSDGPSAVHRSRRANARPTMLVATSEARVTSPAYAAASK